MSFNHTSVLRRRVTRHQLVLLHVPTRAGRVADFLDFGIMMCLDALTREESCGGHFRTEFQDAGEAKRDDAQYAHAAVWEWTGEGQLPARHVEPLVYEETQLSTRSYK